MTRSRFPPPKCGIFQIFLTGSLTIWMFLILKNKHLWWFYYWNKTSYTSSFIPCCALRTLWRCKTHFQITRVYMLPAILILPFLSFAVFIFLQLNPSITWPANIHHLEHAFYHGFTHRVPSVILATCHGSLSSILAYFLNIGIYITRTIGSETHLIQIIVTRPDYVGGKKCGCGRREPGLRQVTHQRYSVVEQQVCPHLKSSFRKLTVFE